MKTSTWLGIEGALRLLVVYFSVSGLMLCWWLANRTVKTSQTQNIEMQEFSFDPNFEIMEPDSPDVVIYDERPLVDPESISDLTYLIQSVRRDRSLIKS